MQPIILASQSPRRKQLLEWAEIDFEIIVQATDETYPAELPVEEVPVHIALNKAKAVQQSAQLQQRIILAADTIVTIDNIIIGKPADRNNAIEILQLLSGKTHKVITGVVLMKDANINSFYDVTEVTFNHLSTDEIAFYIDKYQPYDKAGAYAIQEWIGVVGIKSISGDFYNVMGLPVNRVVKELKQFGL